jgi:hypothetical protein
MIAIFLSTNANHLAVFGEFLIVQQSGSRFPMKLPERKSKRKWLPRPRQLSPELVIPPKSVTFSGDCIIVRC